jgi:filamentous hemagglutinin
LTDEVEREELIGQLRASGVKHNPENILRITRLSEGKIVFLEIGNDISGWQHIRKDHANDFANRGIPEDMIIDAIMSAVTSGIIIGTQGTKRKRDVYEIEFNGVVQYISISVGENGYIVGANPTNKDLIYRLLRERQ